jgi:catechol 2,3-dioxygenase
VPRTPRAVHTIAVLLVGVLLTGCGASAARDASGGTTPSSTAADAPPAPRPASLPAAATLGTTTLVVHDLGLVADYYTNALGLERLRSSRGSTGDTVRLGHGRKALIELVSDPDAPARAATDAGLFHTALLYPDARTLADVLVRVAGHAPESFAGASDHRVSRAFYFTDPEGNGVELYVDRPREEWAWVDGEVQMGSAPLDINEFIAEHASDPGAAAKVTGRVGHMHLAVGELAGAEDFYADLIGFDVVARSDGAVFLSAGGYHHHVAVNTWNTAGAAPRPTGQQGLGSLSVRLPDAAAVRDVAERLAAAGVEHTVAGGRLRTQDPWNNDVVLHS